MPDATNAVDPPADRGLPMLLLVPPKSAKLERTRAGREAQRIRASIVSLLPAILAGRDHGFKSGSKDGDASGRVPEVGEDWSKTTSVTRTRLTATSSKKRQRASQIRSLCDPCTRPKRVVIVYVRTRRVAQDRAGFLPKRATPCRRAAKRALDPMEKTHLRFPYFCAISFLPSGLPRTPTGHVGAANLVVNPKFWQSAARGRLTLPSLLSKPWLSGREVPVFWAKVQL